MSKKLIRLTESDLHKIVKESVQRILNESDDFGQTTPKVIYYETGGQQRVPLFSYEGISYEEAERVINEKMPQFKNYELVEPEIIERKREKLNGWRQSQWFIYPYMELISGKHYNMGESF